VVLNFIQSLISAVIEEVSVLLQMARTGGGGSIIVLLYRKPSTQRGGGLRAMIKANNEREGKNNIRKKSAGELHTT